MLSMPAAITTSYAPAITPCAAKCAACWDEPHWRSTVVPTVDSGKPAASAALRATLMPCSPTCMTQQMITSSTSAGSTSLRSTSAFSTCAARSTGCWSLSLPLRRPRGVRRASTITALGIPASKFRDEAGLFRELDRAVKSGAGPETRQARRVLLEHFPTVRDLLIIRHGQSEWNLERRWQGWKDAPLTELGVQQARERAASLADSGFRPVVVHSSDLGRARQTAEIVADALGVPLRLDDGFRERSGGDWEGHTAAEIDQLWPGMRDAWRRGEIHCPPGGETDDVVLERFDAALARTRADGL